MRYRLSALLILVSLDVACGSSVSTNAANPNSSNASTLSTGPYALTFSGSGFDPHNGQTLYATLVQDGDVKVNAAETVYDGAFAVRWYGVLLKNDTYAVAYFADLNGNGKCDPPPTDHVWEVSVPAITGDAVVAVQHNTNFTNVCNLFTGTAGGGAAASVTINASGFTPNVGEVFTAALVDNANTTVATQKATIAADAFAVTFANQAQVGKAYTADAYVDVNKNGFCNIPPIDHSWAVAVPAITGNTNVSLPANANNTAVCAAFGTYALTVNGTGYAQYNGQNLYLEVFDASDKSPVLGPAVSAVANGNVTFAWSTPLVPGHTYTVEYFVDANNNKTCDPGVIGDPGWTTSIPAVMANVVLPITPNDNMTNVCNEITTPLP